jgi:LEA14-like dessication related protein
MSIHRHTIVLFVTVAALLAAACATMSGRDPLNVTVAGVEPLKGEGLELRLGVKLRVQNPNDDAIDYDGVHVQLNVEGKSFASGVSDAHGTVPRYGEAVIMVPVTVPAIKMAFGALNVINGKYSGKINYDLDGKLDGPTFSSVRFSSNGQLDLSGIASHPSN